MINLTIAQAAALEAFCESFELHTTGVWPEIEEAMREDFGIKDPATALGEARLALRGNQK